MDGHLYFAPAPFPGARRSSNALVAMLELLPDRAAWVAYLIAWTGDPYIGLSMSGANRWWWDVQFGRCNWCFMFHVDTPGTAIFVARFPERFRDFDYRSLTLTYCMPCVGLATDLRVSRETHTWCRGCLAWIRDAAPCEHLFPY